MSGSAVAVRSATPVLAALSFGAILFAARSRAQACSCAFQQTIVSPADQATNVPLNAVVIARYAYGFKPTVALRNLTTGENVPTTLDVRFPGHTAAGTTAFATPTARLDPSTSYVIIVGDDFSRAPPIMTSFTTGEEVDTTAVAFAGITSLRAETMQYPLPMPDGSECFDSCIDTYPGHVSRIYVDFADPPPDAVHVALQLYEPGGTFVSETPISRDSPRFLGFESCDVEAPVLIPGVRRGRCQFRQPEERLSGARARRVVDTIDTVPS
jgi:hypothetical protein